MSKYNVHAGHNSIVPGAAKYLNEVTENRKVKNKLIQLLRAAGNTVYDCTDEGGDTQSKNLANIVAKCNAHSVDLDISIHLNAGGGTGTEVLYTSEKGKAYAAKVSAAVAAALGIKDRGAKERNNLYVLNHTKAPAILVECCFVDSTTDRDRWDVDKCADAIVQGITGKAAAMENNTSTGSEKTDEAEKTETNKKETSSAKAVNYKVKINTASGVNVRKGPGENYSKIIAVANGKTTTITKEQDGWGYAKEYAGWICLKYTKKVTTSTTTSSTKKDNDIAELQQECNKQGFSNQKVDGIVGPNTLAGCPTVKKGAKGNITKWIQKRLISLGYSCGSSGADGDFGSGTEKAVKNFQKANGLTADGIVGKDTWKKLLGM